MKARNRRFAWIGAGLAALGVAVALVLNAFQSNLVFFFTPSQVIAKEAPQARPFRIGGMAAFAGEAMAIDFDGTGGNNTVFQARGVAEFSTAASPPDPREVFVASQSAAWRETSAKASC